MLEFLANLDTQLFLFFNVTLANPVTDIIMPIVTNDWFLRVLFAVAIVLLLIFGSARLRWAVLFSVIVVVLTDQLSAGLLKPMIGRMRPCHVLDGINLLVTCGGGKSMPSSHAANSFGQAALFALLFPRWRCWLLIFAALVAMSRVMVGVHYPFDVLVGAMLGAAVAGIVAFAGMRTPIWRRKRA